MSSSPAPEEPTARDHWEAQAADWIAVTDDDPQYEELNKPSFLELIPAPGDLTIDVGCGEGRLARELVTLGHRVVELDASPTLARTARSRNGLPTVVSDVTRLPVRSASADIVVCFMVLMDIEALDDAVAELARTLTHHGTLCIGILHPIMSSGLFLPGDEHRTFYMGEYARPMRHSLDVERVNGQVFRFRVEHRPIERYVRALEGAGLAVTALREPRPDDDLVARLPEFANMQRVPNFLQLRARRID